RHRHRSCREHLGGWRLVGRCGAGGFVATRGKGRARPLRCRPRPPGITASYPMAFTLARVSISTRRKLTSIALAATIFSLLPGFASFATRGSVVYAIIDSILVGTGVGLFEQFYVQSLRGRWLRSMHPLLSISIYTAVVALLFVFAVHLSHLLTGELDTLPRA